MTYRIDSHSVEEIEQDVRIFIAEYFPQGKNFSLNLSLMLNHLLFLLGVRLTSGADPNKVNELFPPGICRTRDVVLPSETK